MHSRLLAILHQLTARIAAPSPQVDPEPNLDEQIGKMDGVQDVYPVSWTLSRLPELVQHPGEDIEDSDRRALIVISFHQPPVFQKTQPTNSSKQSDRIDSDWLRGYTRGFHVAQFKRVTGL